MAVLSDDDRARVWRGLMRFWSAQHEPVTGINKTDLRTAVNDMDDYLNTNAATINSALPNPFRSNATNPQKAVLFACVTLARYDVAALRRLLGDID